MTSVAYDWQLTYDLDAFLGRAGDFLRSRPARHTVALTVTDGLRRRGTDRFGESAPLFGALERDGAVGAAFFRTPPYRLNLTSLDERGADTLAALLADAEIEVPGVTADTDTALAFAEAWRRRTGSTAELRRSERLYGLGDLAVPEPAPPGRARVAGEADRELLARWYTEFAEAIGEGGYRDGGGWADDRISYGGATFWETPTAPPSPWPARHPRSPDRSASAPSTPRPLCAGRGYAGAVTAEVSRAAVATGVQAVLLFTDLANPTSNSLYQRIGYRPVSDFATYDFR